MFDFIYTIINKLIGAPFREMYMKCKWNVFACLFFLMIMVGNAHAMHQRRMMRQELSQSMEMLAQICHQYAHVIVKPTDYL